MGDRLLVIITVHDECTTVSSTSETAATFRILGDGLFYVCAFLYDFRTRVLASLHYGVAVHCLMIRSNTYWHYKAAHMPVRTSLFRITRSWKFTSPTLCMGVDFFPLCAYGTHRFPRKQWKLSIRPQNALVIWKGFEWTDASNYGLIFVDTRWKKGLFSRLIVWRLTKWLLWLKMLTFDCVWTDRDWSTVRLICLSNTTNFNLFIVGFRISLMLLNFQIFRVGHGFVCLLCLCTFYRSETPFEVRLRYCSASLSRICETGALTFSANVNFWRIRLKFICGDRFDSRAIATGTGRDFKKWKYLKIKFEMEKGREIPKTFILLHTCVTGD